MTRLEQWTNRHIDKNSLLHSVIKHNFINKDKTLEDLMYDVKTQQIRKYRGLGNSRYRQLVKLLDDTSIIPFEDDFNNLENAIRELPLSSAQKTYAISCFDTLKHKIKKL